MPLPHLTLALGVSACTTVCCLVLQEILERFCGMAPSLCTAEQISAYARKLALRELHEEHGVPVLRGHALEERTARRTADLRRMTKSLDREGRFRTQPRASVRVVDGVFSVTMSLFILYSIVVARPEWFKEHYWDYQRSTIEYWPYACVGGGYIGVFLYELAVGRYARFDAPFWTHHVVAVGVNLALLAGLFAPPFVWFGITHAAFTPPLYAVMAWRSGYAHLAPRATQQMLVAISYYFTVTSIVTFVGFVVIVTRGVVIGHWEWWSALLLYAAVSSWFAQDISATRGLLSLAKINYHGLDVTQCSAQDEGHTCSTCAIEP